MSNRPSWQKKEWLVWKATPWSEDALIKNPQAIVGYPFGLELHAGDQCEIHGAFATAGEAMAYGTRLMNNYSDYESCMVVKIETPQVGQTFKRGEGWLTPGGHYELTCDDVGKALIACFGRNWATSDFIGRVLPTDVGKRVYLKGDILQVENEEQRANRLMWRK